MKVAVVPVDFDVESAMKHADPTTGAMPIITVSIPRNSKPVDSVVRMERGSVIATPGQALSARPIPAVYFQMDLDEPKVDRHFLFANVRGVVDTNGDQAVFTFVALFPDPQGGGLVLYEVTSLDAQMLSPVPSDG